MKQIKLYNVIFPIWLLWLFPPIIFIVIFGNALIDSLVLFAIFKGLKIHLLGYEFKPFYFKTIFKVWGFGIIGDIIGAAILFGILMLDTVFHMNSDILEGLSLNPFGNITAFLIILLCVLISAGIIFLLNYFFTFKKLFSDNPVRFKCALYVALATMPWTFFIPSSLIYSNF